MSDKQQLVNARNEINSLIKSDYRISLANKDTFYLYSTDRNLLATIDYFYDGKSKPKYTVFVNGLPNCRKFDKSNETCHKLYNKVNAVYNYDSMLWQKIDNTPFTMLHVQDMWNYARNSKSIEKEQDFLRDLISELIARKCPIDLIQRTIYCFAESGVTHGFPEGFTVLNSLYKLVEYKTPRKNIWFYTGENSTGRFVPMDNESRGLFNDVKIALQNQKQNVK